MGGSDQIGSDRSCPTRFPSVLFGFMFYLFFEKSEVREKSVRAGNGRPFCQYFRLQKSHTTTRQATTNTKKLWLHEEYHIVSSQLKVLMQVID